MDDLITIFTRADPHCITGRNPSPGVYCIRITGEDRLRLLAALALLPK